MNQFISRGNPLWMTPRALDQIDFNAEDSHIPRGFPYRELCYLGVIRNIFIPFHTFEVHNLLYHHYKPVYLWGKSPIGDPRSKFSKFTTNSLILMLFI